MKNDISKFCNIKSERVEYQKPFRIDENGVYASDGMILIYCMDVNNNIDLVMNIDIYKQCSDLILKYRSLSDNFQTITAVMIDNLLKDIIPIKLPIIEEKLCPDCDGVGSVICECDCGNEHERNCDKCEGEGYIDGEQIGEEIQRTPVNFNGVLIDYKYLKLIQEVIENNNEIWEMRISRKKDICVFRCDTILICVMPIVILF